MEAVASQLRRGDVVADVAGLGGLSHQVSDHLVELVLGRSEVLVAMQERRELGVAVAMGCLLYTSPSPRDS